MANLSKKAKKLLKNTAELISECKFQEAEDLYKKLTKVNPDHPGNLFVLGTLRYHQRRWNEASELLELAHSAAPDEKECRKLLLATYIDGGQTDKALALAREFLANLTDHSLLLPISSLFCKTCCWAEAQVIRQQAFNIVLQRKPDISPFIPGFLLIINGLENINPDTHYALHKTAELLALPANLQNTPSQQQYKPEHRIKVAYLSPDFKAHPVSYFMYPLLIAHDRTRLEVYCYAQIVGKDKITDLIDNAADHFIDITNMSNKEVADRVRTDGIQILVDLAGHTQHSRIQVLNYRAAPVQISYLGYPNTSGLPEVDFRITDNFAESQNGTRYTEQLLYMPQSFLCFGMEPGMGRISSTPAKLCDYITYGVFASPHKINPSAISAWSRILQKVPDSILALKARWNSSIVQENIFQEFSLHGISKERIHLLPVSEDYNEYLKQFNRIDIVLDTFPYSGTTTTCESLMMGVPIVTLVGPLHAQRVSYSILKNIGFEETITYTVDDYINKAVQLANNLDGLDVLRKTLPMLLKYSITGQPQQFTKQLESLYFEACRRKGVDIADIL